MGWKQRNLGSARVVVGAVAGSVAVTFLLATPAGATPSDGPDRTLPPRHELTASGLTDLATTNSPYQVAIFGCGDQSTLNLYFTRSFVTLYAYGGDGGGNGSGTAGGAGSLAAGAYDLPYLNPGAWLVEGRPGCKGGAARSDDRAPGPGGTSVFSSGGWPGLGGDGGTGAAVGASGGGGGSASIWLVSQSGFPYGHAVYASGGGGAGAGTGAGRGGDGDHAGEAASTGGAAPGQPGSVLAGGPDYLTHAGAGGVHSADGQKYSGGVGGSGSVANGVGGGGGGAGWGGGGGGAPGAQGTGPGAGGAGGGSVVHLTNAGYSAGGGGFGHGAGEDGFLERVEVRAVTRQPTFPGRDVVRGLAPNGKRGGGYEVLGNGDIRTFSQGVNPTAAKNGASWPGQDVARGIATLPDRSGGYVVDLHGQLHPFTIGDHGPPPAVTDRVLWPGKDIARGIAILPDGTGGYVLARDGRLYSFAIGRHPKPPDAQRVPIWKGRDVTRGVTAPFVDEHGVAGGWITDVFGGLHPWGRLFGAPTPEAVGPNVAARGVVSFVDGAGGLLVDGAGNLTPFASPGYP